MRRCLALLLLVHAAACARGGSAPPMTVAPVATGAVPAVSTTPLRPGDVVRMRVWREPEMSGDFTVSERGEVTLPRLGVVAVTGVPMPELQERLKAEYRQYLQNPTIEVIPLRRVAVTGAVRSPGIYPVEPSMTVGDAVGLAGGATNEGRQNVVMLRRDGQRREIDFRKHPEMVRLPLQSGDELIVPERSWASRNSVFLVSTGVGFLGTMLFVMSR